MFTSSENGQGIYGTSGAHRWHIRVIIRHTSRHQRGIDGASTRHPSFILVVFQLGVRSWQAGQVRRAVEPVSGHCYCSSEGEVKWSRESMMEISELTQKRAHFKCVKVIITLEFACRISYRELANSSSEFQGPQGFHDRTGLGRSRSAHLCL